jgi:hypothetical protein
MLLETSFRHWKHQLLVQFGVWLRGLGSYDDVGTFRAARTAIARQIPLLAPVNESVLFIRSGMCPMSSLFSFSAVVSLWLIWPSKVCRAAQLHGGADLSFCFVFADINRLVLPRQL